MAVKWMAVAMAFTDKVDATDKGDKKCRALSLMGGGVKGNYETGVL